MPDSPRGPEEQLPEAHDSLAAPSAPVAPASGESAPTGQIQSSRRRWPWLLLFVLLLLGLSGYFLWPKIADPKAGGAGAKSAGTGPAPIPVVAAKSRKGDIGVY